MVALTVVGVGLGLGFRLLGSGRADPSNDAQAALYGASAVPFALMGALVTVRRPGNQIGWLLLVVGLAIGLLDFAAEYVRYGATHPDAVPTLWPVAWLAGWVWAPAIGAVMMLLLLYPEGRLPSPAWQPVAWAVAGLMAVSVVDSALLPTIEVEGVPPIDNPIGLPATVGDVVRASEVILPLLFIVLLLMSGSSLVVRFRRARGVERQQLKWLTYAATLTVVFWALAVPGWPGDWVGIVLALLLWSFPVAIAVAVLRYRLYDIDRLINRTLVYGTLTALLAGVYAGTVLVLGQLFGGIANKSPSLVVAGATLAVAALFQPARRRIQQVVDRRFNRRRYDAAKTVEAFSARLRDEIELDTLSSELLAVVDQTVQPAKASLWLRPPTQVTPRGQGQASQPTPDSAMTHRASSAGRMTMAPTRRRRFPLDWRMRLVRGDQLPRWQEGGGLTAAWVGRVELWPPSEVVPGGGGVGSLTCGSLAPVVTARARCTPLPAGSACTHCVPAGCGPVRSPTLWCSVLHDARGSTAITRPVAVLPGWAARTELGHQ